MNIYVLFFSPLKTHFLTVSSEEYNITCTIESGIRRIHDYLECLEKRELGNEQINEANIDIQN